MIIGYVLDDTLDKGDGVQQAVVAIGEKMRSLGHEVHYVVAETKRTDLQNIHSISKFISMNFNGNSIRTPLPAPKKQIKHLFSNVQFDVLHVQLPYSPFLASRVIKCASKNTRIVGTFHILPFNWLSRAGTRLLSWVLHSSKKKFTAVYAVSPPALDFMKKDFGLKGQVLANPVDYRFFHSHINYDKPKKTRIVFLGRFDERKGVKQLVYAYEKMKNRESVELIMCGNGPLLEELQKYSIANSLGITFTGFVDDEQKADYLASAHIAVFPSTGGESFGIVLTEAMSAGSEVILAGNNLGYASVLSDWPEVLFNPNDVDAFSRTMDDFVNDKNKRKNIGSQQQEYVKQFDIELIVKRLLDEAYL